jgi:hypothetical protein
MDLQNIMACIHTVRQLTATPPLSSVTYATTRDMTQHGTSSDTTHNARPTTRHASDRCVVVSSVQELLPRTADDTELAGYILSASAPTYHAASSCKYGPDDDPSAVVRSPSNKFLTNKE